MARLIGDLVKKSACLLINLKKMEKTYYATYCRDGAFVEVQLRSEEEANALRNLQKTNPEVWQKIGMPSVDVDEEVTPKSQDLKKKPAD